MSEGASTGGGGFTQSSNAFGGFNNTDLRGRRRRRIPLLNTSWVVRPRTKESRMRKSLEGLVATLRGSAIEIAASGVDNSEELLTKSFGEFDIALQAQLDTEFGPDGEVLAKGLNHISSFASALNRINQVVTAIKTGRPSYMLDSDSSMPIEELPPEIQEDLDHFIAVGVLVLRTMVNNTVELPIDDADMQRAEKAGELVKIDGVTGEILVKSHLTDDYLEFITDPVELLVEAAELSKSFLGRATALGEVLLAANPLAIPKEIADSYPEIFIVDGADTLGKAFPPPKKKTPPAAGGGNDNSGSDATAGADDQGSGEDPPDDGTDPNDLTDDVPQDPMQMIARLATMITVIAGGISQGAAGGDVADPADDGSAAATMEGDPNDPRNVGLRRSEPMPDQPLAKIFVGHIEGDQTLVDVLTERDRLQKRVAELEKGEGDTATALKVMQDRMALLDTTPRAAVGVTRIVPTVTKQADNTPGGLQKTDLMAEVAELQKRNPEGDSAAKRLITEVHGRGPTSGF